jgi:hypothetical protein
MTTRVTEPRLPRLEELFEAQSKLSAAHEYVEQNVWHLEGLIDPRLTEADPEVTYAQIGWLWEFTEDMEGRAGELTAFANQVRAWMRHAHGIGFHSGDPSLEEAPVTA